MSHLLIFSRNLSDAELIHEMDSAAGGHAIKRSRFT
jgi:hypothetical protein